MFRHDETKPIWIQKANEGVAAHLSETGGDCGQVETPGDRGDRAAGAATAAGGDGATGPESVAGVTFRATAPAYHAIAREGASGANCPGMPHPHPRPSVGR